MGRIFTPTTGKMGAFGSAMSAALLPKMCQFDVGQKYIKSTSVSLARFQKRKVIA